MKFILVILFLFLTHFDEPNFDLKFWCRINFEINSNRLVNNDSINKYFSFYKKGAKVKLENKMPIDILLIDSIVVRCDNVIFKIGKYMSYSKDSSFIKSFEGDTLDFDCFFYSDFKKSLGSDYPLPDSLEFYGLILNNIHIFKEY